MPRDRPMEAPTSSAPTKPGPAVYAIPPISDCSMPALMITSSISGNVLRMWSRDASSGITPPYFACISIWLYKQSASRPRSLSYSATPVSSHDVSIPSTINGLTLSLLLSLLLSIDSKSQSGLSEKRQSCQICRHIPNSLHLRLVLRPNSQPIRANSFAIRASGH